MGNVFETVKSLALWKVDGFGWASHHKKAEQRAYGIEVVPAVDDKSSIKITVRDPPTRKPSPPRKEWFWYIEPATKDLSIRLVALLFIIGLLILILYYENTILDTPFETFMDSQSFSVRILFTSFGTIMRGCWDHFFSHKLSREVLVQG